MTAKEAKERTLYFWKYLVEHPEIEGKEHLPEEMLKEIDKYFCCCPLCHYHKYNHIEQRCEKCVLTSCQYGSLYGRYTDAMTKEERRVAAQAIVDKVSEWEVQE
jgi:hypothetical protein